MHTTDYLIAGSSHAALEAINAIRMHDGEGSITVVTRDPHRPYSPTVLPYVVSGRSILWSKWCLMRPPVHMPLPAMMIAPSRTLLRRFDSSAEET